MYFKYHTQHNHLLMFFFNSDNIELKFHSIIICLKFHDHEFNSLNLLLKRSTLRTLRLYVQETKRGKIFARGSNYTKISNKHLPCLEVGPSGCPHPAPGGGQSYPLHRQQTNSSLPFCPMQSCVVGGNNSA